MTNNEQSPLVGQSIFFGRHQLDVADADYDVVVVYGRHDVHRPHGRPSERVAVLQRLDYVLQTVGVHHGGHGVQGAVLTERVQFGRHAERQSVDGRVQHVASVVFHNQQAVP